VGSGCSGRFITLLKKHGYEVEGLDISAEMIALAKTRHPDITFHHADVCEWTPPRSYDFITAWDSIWHVPMDRSELVLRKLCQALAPGGVFIWTTAGLDEAVEKEDASMGQPLYYSVLGIRRTLEILTEEGCVCWHLEHDQMPELHVFLIAEKGR
jgi:2-polyprenyl-3-methyl-5-hydroxy-6-metoxy-1,4-benzoquinol methylase